MLRQIVSMLLLGASAHATADDRQYLELTAGEFTLVSAASEEETRRIAGEIRTFRAGIERALGVALSPAVPTRIYALSKEDWVRYARPRAGTSGYFLANPFSSDLLFDAEDAAAGVFDLIFHEYAHFVLRMSVSQEVPAFFDEGLAELFSTARFSEGVVRFEPRKDYLRLLRSRRWISFERLVAVKRHDPEYVDHGLAPAFYAQAWATMYYALAVDPGIHSRLRAYLRALENGDPLMEAVEALLGCSGAEANRQIAAFIRRRALPHIEVAVMKPSEEVLAPIRRLERAESRLALSELVLRMGGRSKQAQDLLRQMPEDSRHQARASVLNAWLHLQDGRPDDATRILDAVQVSALDGRTRVALARGLFQVAATGSSSDMSPDQRLRLRRAEALFDAALDDRTTRLEAINGYVLTRLALDEHDESLITLAEIAYQAAPRSSELAVALAILHELAGRRQIARNYWRSAARNTQMEPMRSRILDRLNSNSLPAPASTPR
jgi:hypothetical protein